ncbi:glycoside hydrolase/phage tail family protein [Phaeobacter sp. HF9A]|uniref:baseplate multidomain protein megatron n=1 Tax=Phaeobacter sp. HF9A TaxID=2721561 RepID=UPI00142F44DF|nr:glycoside hydrolase/phage tail family protein [Phaeobacter sp. HF9A]NIZ13735.1 host specificity protein [Phaeobacter sp. HF9A]
MATLVLAAAGSAIGGAIGGSVAGLSTAIIGRAVGATLGRAIDERLLGSGSAAVDTGKVDRFRLTNASDGEPMAQVFGRMRMGGQVIWATEFVETASTTSQGGKGTTPSRTTTSYSYTLSMAVAICAGEICRVSRIWADGEEIGLSDLNMTLYTGSRDQQPDPLMEAVEGAGEVPAYRGTAYVVFENLDLERFGNRVPQFSFEVLRAEQPDGGDYASDLAQIVPGVALIPGTGEYSLATSPVYLQHGPGDNQAMNLNQISGQSDLVTSAQALSEELPQAQAVSLVVCWFGDDLRCGDCLIKPKVEQTQADGSMPWVVSDLARADAEQVILEEGAPLYGGTPADAAVIEGIRHLNETGKSVMFYPFILMEQQAGNTLPDPYSDAIGQPVLPWRGRITLSKGPGWPGSPDGSALADAEVADFLGAAQASDFTISDGTVSYTGDPSDWGFRRFILHYAALCAAAGGVESFCVGSELRGLTRIRGATGFPFVEALRDLVGEVRSLLGPEVKLGYAADWSEYWGYQTPEGDRIFHLDPLWAEEELDFVGIDNYMPLSDWRDGQDHLDAQTWPDIYTLDYLASNIEGGEGFDWYYHSPEAAAAQIRTPITDGGFGEPWIYRYKDIRSWWSYPHHDRIGGVRAAAPTELGCAAIDKGTNQPNKFLDPKSSESKLPKYSNGLRDDLIQLQYLRAQLTYWRDPAHNPVSVEYGASMLDMDHAYVWAWDARPFPAFPNRVDLWSDGDNYARGHWLNGRVGQRTLASVVAEVCARAGVREIDVSGLWGMVRGYALYDVGEARAALQPLMLRHGFDAIERDGRLVFRLRDGLNPLALEAAEFAVLDEMDGELEQSRVPEAELTGRVRLRFIEWGGSHDTVAEEAVLPDEATHSVSQNELPMALTRAEGQQVVQRWLAEARISRDSARVALPPSRALQIGAGDVVELPDQAGEGAALYRVDGVEQGEAQILEAVRIEPVVYEPLRAEEVLPQSAAFAAPTPVLPLFLDLPLMRGEEVPHAPHVCASARQWPGAVALYGADLGAEFTLQELLPARATVGITKSVLAAGPVGYWDRGADLEVELIGGALDSVGRAAVLNGANRLAIGDGSPGNWEVMQFAEAELIAPNRYLIRDRLRGQYGSDGLMPPSWPMGSYVVLLDAAVEQLDLSISQRRSARDYRFGPARRPYDDPSYVALSAAFDGNGLRPYAPAHLRQTGTVGGDVALSWIRRTRIEGDSWDLEEVPLGEESEAYRLRVLSGGAVLREERLTSANWSYSSAMQASDGVSAGDLVQVAQISARYGAGLAAELVLG